MAYAQEKKATTIDDLQSQASQGAVAESDPSAKSAQMTQGYSMETGALANALQKGESGSGNAYGAFNYYKSDGTLGSAFHGLIEGKPINEHTVGHLRALSQEGSTLAISYTDGDAPRTVTGRLFALGKYQMIPDTLKEAQTAVGMRDDDVFSSQNQDICFSQYLIRGKRPAIINYLTGKGSLEAAAQAVAQEWASVGIKPGTVNSHGRTGDASGKTSYYAGDGVNNASISYQTIIKALQEDKAAIEAGGIAKNTVVHGNTMTAANTTTNEVPQEASAKVEASAIPETSVDIDVERAIRINLKYGYSESTWRDIQSGVGLTGDDVDGICGKNTCKAIADWQATHGFSGNDIDGICGPSTLAAIQAKGKTVSEQEAQAQPQTESQTGEQAEPSTENKQFQYFSIQELTHSDTANAKHIDNTPTKAAVENMSALITHCLDPLRDAYGAPITVNSGYRCEKLNAAVGGVSNSQHMSGEAADLDVGSRAHNKALYELAIKLQKQGVLQFDQLLDEKGFSWVHISYSRSHNRIDIRSL